jgi:hypothetical protein
MTRNKVHEFEVGQRFGVHQSIWLLTEFQTRYSCRLQAVSGLDGQKNKITGCCLYPSLNELRELLQKGLIERLESTKNEEKYLSYLQKKQNSLV